VRLSLLALACVLAGGAARADEADEARTHYQAAQHHYDEGRYDEAITEFEAAYRLKPHPNVLYNIAQAHERLLDYNQSVKYFERYLAEAPPDAEFRTAVSNRLRILRGLPARISFTTIPEHVHVTVVGTKSFAGDTPTLFSVPAGDYVVRLEQPGWETEEHALRADIGQPYFYQYRLQRSTSPVSIFTRPRGARVFIDNRLVGETPFAEPIEVGHHKLLLEHPDYPWHREEIEVRPNVPLKREVKLTRPVRSGRTELVLASMIYGGAAGAALVATLYNDQKKLYTDTGLGLTLLGSAAGTTLGLLGAFLPTRDGIKVGHSSLIIGGGAWGTAIGAALALGLKLDEQYVLPLSLLGGGLGVTTGILVSRWDDTSAGDAAIVNSGGLWGMATGACLAQAIFDEPKGEQFGWFILGGTALGVAAGTLVAWKLELSRGHVALVDVGGLAGTGLGFALGYVIGATSEKNNGIQSGSRYALGGMALGLLTASILARNYKGDLPPVEALLRRPDGRRWAMGLPNVRIEPAITPEGAATRVVLDLAKGTW
jgi:hypothetical protein